MIAWQVVADGLLGLMRTLPAWSGVEVYDGPTSTAEAPFEHAVLGGETTLTLEDGGRQGLTADAGGFELSRDPTDALEAERGTVTVEVVCWSGDPLDLPTLRARAFTLAAALSDAVRADMTFGRQLLSGATAYLTGTVVLEQLDGGPVVRLPLTLTYTARVT